MSDQSPDIKATLRNSNQRIAECQEGKPVIEDLFCECGHHGCHARLSVPSRTYLRVRRYEGLSFIANGHETPGGACLIVADKHGWSVIEAPRRQLTGASP